MCIVKVTKSVIRQFSDDGILKKRPTVGNVVLTELEETGEVLTMFFNQQTPISINLAFPARRSLHVPGDSKDGGICCWGDRLSITGFEHGCNSLSMYYEPLISCFQDVRYDVVLHVSDNTSGPSKDSSNEIDENDTEVCPKRSENIFRMRKTNARVNKKRTVILNAVLGLNLYFDSLERSSSFYKS